MIRHFAEKQQDEESDSVILRARLQPVPEMFRELVEESLGRVATLTEPLRNTLRLQCETGRLLPWYATGSLVPVTEIFTRIVGNPLWLDIDCEQYIQRYRDTFDPSVLTEIYEFQQLSQSHGRTWLAPKLYQFGFRALKAADRSGFSLHFRRGDGSLIPRGASVNWRETYVQVNEIEEYVRICLPTKVSDTAPLRMENGLLHPWELLFNYPKRPLSEERGDGLCDVSRYMAVGRPGADLVRFAIDSRHTRVTVFERYGQTANDRALRIGSHSLRHLQNTELFRLGVADTIITKRFGRRSISQSYVYDHRSLAEDLEQIELPQEVEVMLGAKTSTVAKLIKCGKARGPIVEAFKRIQATDGDMAAYEYLVAEADGFHATPYGHCLNSFTVDPCPKHLECFAGCRHLSATDLPENRQNLVQLEGKLKLALEVIKGRPSTSIGWQNQLDHAQKRLAGVQKLLETPAGGRPFPDGVDLSLPRQRGVLDE